MPQLPNELWSHIISVIDSDEDLWLSLRHVNRQLQACVEQHFAREILPYLTLSLPLKLPTYDLRSPIRGQATFLFCAQQSRPDSGHGDDGRCYYDLGPTTPEFYLSHFLGRWAGMRDVDGGWLRPSVEWDLMLKGKQVSTRIKECRAIADGIGQGEARIEFEWKPSLTAFFR